MYIDLRKFKQKQNKPKNIALVHDFLIRWGGAEKVLKKLTEMYPDAPVYVLFYEPEFVQKHFSDLKIKASFLQKPYNLCRKISKIPLINLSHRLLVPFFFLAAESLNLSKFNTVISSAGIAKSVITNPECTHISYTHSPIRWLWHDERLYTNSTNQGFRSEKKCEVSQQSWRSEKEDSTSHFSSISQILICTLQNYSLRITRYTLLFLHYINPLTYLRKFKNFLARIFAHFARISDFGAAKRPDLIVANSQYTAQRIKKYYNREAEIIYPPAVPQNKHPDTTEQSSGYGASKLNKKQEIRNKKQEISSRRSLGEGGPNDGSYFVAASRLSTYKNIDIAIRAFNQLGYNLVVIGKGPQLKKLQKIAKDNIYFTGFIEKRKLYKKTIKRALGFVHPCREDFGIAMVEALSLGTPVIAPNHGGAREIVKPGINGELYGAKQTPRYHRSTTSGTRHSRAKIWLRGKQNKHPDTTAVPRRVHGTAEQSSGYGASKTKTHETNTENRVNTDSRKSPQMDIRGYLRSSASSGDVHNEVANLAKTVKRLLAHYSEYEPDQIKKTAQRFSEERFEKQMRKMINARKD